MEELITINTAVAEFRKFLELRESYGEEDAHIIRQYRKDWIEAFRVNLIKRLRASE